MRFVVALALMTNTTPSHVFLETNGSNCTMRRNTKLYQSMRIRTLHLSCVCGSIIQSYCFYSLALRCNDRFASLQSSYISSLQTLPARRSSSENLKVSSTDSQRASSHHQPGPAQPACRWEASRSFRRHRSHCRCPDPSPCRPGGP